MLFGLRINGVQKPREGVKRFSKGLKLDDDVDREGEDDDTDYVDEDYVTAGSGSFDHRPVNEIVEIDITQPLLKNSNSFSSSNSFDNGDEGVDRQVNKTEIEEGII